jgi:hypothetical protein
MPNYSGDTIPCCASCDGKDQTKTCLRCHIVYCQHFASKTDNRFCANCMGDFKLHETIMEKQIIHERSDGIVTFSRKFQARHIKLMGNDWLFAAGLIEHLSDAEIEANIEYHKANVSLMLMERESRKLERYHKLSSIKVVMSPRESQEAREKREAKAAAKGTKTRVKNKTPSADDIVAMLTKLASSGYTPEQLMAAMGRKK